MSDSPIKTFRHAHHMSLEKFGAIFGVNKSTAMRWEGGRIPAERVIEVEGKTGISRHELRPDLYPVERVA